MRKKAPLVLIPIELAVLPKPAKQEQWEEGKPCRFWFGDRVFLQTKGWGVVYGVTYHNTVQDWVYTVVLDGEPQAEFFWGGELTGEDCND